MAENIENKGAKVEAKKPKKMRTRTMLVLVFSAIFILFVLIMYRADYLETLEICEEYLEVFMQNIRYKVYIGASNFIVIFALMYITARFIKKGLKTFFEEEKKEMPKLPNKSIALVVSAITSIVVSNLFLQKVILFVNNAQFGIPDPIFNMDVGFYMFQAPLIGQLLYYGIAILLILSIYTVAYYIIVFNKYFDGIDGQTLRNNTFIKQILVYVMLFAILVSGIMLFNVQNMETGNFLSLDDKMETAIIGARCSRRNKTMGIQNIEHSNHSICLFGN